MLIADEVSSVATCQMFLAMHAGLLAATRQLKDVSDRRVLDQIPKAPVRCQRSA